MKKKILIRTLISLVLVAAVLFVMIWNGVILFNNPSANKYPVRGIDVSSYQGKIDWPVLSSQNISFAFIKATEGSTFVDPNFDYNFAEAQKVDLRIGAYHFFSFDSDGKKQAENFISKVPVTANMLPPVVDVEFYGDKKKNPPKAEDVRAQLDILVAELEKHYGIKPIIYATEESYSLYLSGHYDEFDIWIRNVYNSASLSDSREWTFWQYTNREKLNGYSGKEKYIDMNVFNGTMEEFLNYAKKT